MNLTLESPHFAGVTSSSFNYLKSNGSTPLNSERNLLKSERVINRVAAQEVKLKKFNYLIWKYRSVTLPKLLQLKKIIENNKNTTNL